MISAIWGGSHSNTQQPRHAFAPTAHHRVQSPYTTEALFPKFQDPRLTTFSTTLANSISIRLYRRSISRTTLSKDFSLALIRLMLELIPTVCNSTRLLVR